MSRVKKPLTPAQVKDAGMALSLVCLLAGIGLRHRWLEWTAAAVLLVDMAWPPVFRPFAVGWFGLAEAIGAVTSRLLLGLLFVVIVTPVGRIRRLLGRDSMLLTRWRRDRSSTFRVRDHQYQPADVEHPY